MPFGGLFKPPLEVVVGDLESGPMSETCSYLSYEAVTALHNERNLHHLNDSVLDEYAEYAQEAEF